jgi:hypothetical protein
VVGSPASHYLFSFGTLGQPEVQSSVFGRRLEGRSDRLPGYRLTTVKITDPEVVRISGSGEHPMLQVSDDPNDYVDGTVFEVTDEELSAADAYEDHSYVRASVTLSLSSHKPPFEGRLARGSASFSPEPARVATAASHWYEGRAARGARRAFGFIDQAFAKTRPWARRPVAAQDRVLKRRLTWVSDYGSSPETRVVGNSVTQTLRS